MRCYDDDDLDDVGLFLGSFYSKILQKDVG